MKKFKNALKKNLIFTIKNYYLLIFKNMNEIRFNIDHFKIQNYGDWYKHFLYFLIKMLFTPEKFPWIIKKQDFIAKWIEFWYKKRFLENVFEKWKKSDFLRVNFKNNNTFIATKSVIDKEKTNNLLVYIDETLLKRIIDIDSFRYLCYIVLACRPFRTEKGFKENEYFYKNSSRTIQSIAKYFWDVDKTVMSKRLNKAQKYFKDVFRISKRYSSFDFFNKKYIVQLSNLYSVNGVRYKLVRNKIKNKKKWNKYDKSFYYVKPKFIWSKNIKFWNLEKHNWFLPSECYKTLWKQIKAKIFW